MRRASWMPWRRGSIGRKKEKRRAKPKCQPPKEVCPCIITRRPYVRSSAGWSGGTESPWCCCTGSWGRCTTGTRYWTRWASGYRAIAGPRCPSSIGGELREAGIRGRARALRAAPPGRARRSAGGDRGQFTGRARGPACWPSSTGSACRGWSSPDRPGCSSGASRVACLTVRTGTWVRRKMEEVFFDPALVTRRSGSRTCYRLVTTPASALRVSRLAGVATRDGTTWRRRDAHGEIRVPTLLIWGLEDRITPPAVAERFRAHPPDAHLWLSLVGAGTPRCSSGRSRSRRCWPTGSREFEEPAGDRGASARRRAVIGRRGGGIGARLVTQAGGVGSSRRSASTRSRCRSGGCARASDRDGARYGVRARPRVPGHPLSAAEYQARVPVRDYVDSKLRPWLERAAAGEESWSSVARPVPGLGEDLGHHGG